MYTDQLPAGTTAQMLCGCSCPDPEPVVVDCSTAPVEEDCETCCVYEAGTWVNSNVYQLGGVSAPTLASSSNDADDDTSNDWQLSSATWSETIDNADGTITAVYLGGVLSSECFNGEVVVSTTYGTDESTGLPNTAIDFSLSDVDGSVIFNSVSVPNIPTDDELANAQLSGTVSASASIFVDSSLDLGCGCGNPAAAEGFDCAGDPLVCDGSGTNNNGVVAAQFYGFGCEGAIATMIGQYGYTEEQACAFNGMVPATDDDGNMIFDENGVPQMVQQFDLGGLTFGDFCACSCADPVVLGCTEQDACNYNADANQDDNSCTYAEAGFNCDGTCVSGDLVTFTVFESYGDGGDGQLSLNGTLVVDGVPYGAANASGSVCVDMAACNTWSFLSTETFSNELSFSITSGGATLASASGLVFLFMVTQNQAFLVLVVLLLVEILQRKTIMQMQT
jgi:hypothetical protein